MNKKKVLIACVSILFIGLGVYQGTMANFNEQGSLETKISAGSLGVEFVNEESTILEDSFDFNKAMPGALFEKNIAITNTKDKDLYTRVTLTRYWVDENGDKVVEANAKDIQILNDTNNWIVMDDTGSNDERIIFYYKMPIGSKQTTEAFMSSIKLNEEITDKQYSQYKAHIELEAEAIQKVGAVDAILSQWGIDVTFDNQGNIVDIIE